MSKQISKLLSRPVPRTEARIRTNRPEYTFHWSMENFYAENISALITRIPATGMCYGMALAWLSGVLRDNLPITSMPDLALSLSYHLYLKKCANRYESKTISLAQGHGGCQYPTTSIMLSELWSKADENSGYILTKFNESGTRAHSCAFLKYRNRGYIMLPNAGLYECEYLHSLNECFLKDEVFRAFEKIKGPVIAEAFKW